MELSESKRTRLLICLGLALATIGVYARVGGFNFVNFDDPDYVTNNSMVKAGLTFKGVVWAFAHGYVSNWHPLTWISHMVDYQMFGMHPGGMHLVNVVLHTANSVLLFLLLQRTTRAQWPSAIAAALFALHPMHVESVAWISERKDVLSTFFALLTLLAYVRYANESKVQGPRSKVWYAAALLLFALGLMAKSMLVTLPFVMLLLDFWPLCRFQNLRSCASDSESGVAEHGTLPAGVNPAAAEEGRSVKMLLLEKTPFFFLSIASSAITFYVQKTGGSVVNMRVFPFVWRVYVAIESYVWYAQKLFWPVHLAMFYPIQTHRPLPRFICSCVILLVVSVAAILMSKRRPFLLVGWLWFLGTLVPVIGLVQVGAQETADRYSYLPSIGPFIAVIWLIYEFVKRSKIRMMFAVSVAGVVLALLSTATFVQAGYWKDSLTLFQHTVEVTHNNDTMLNNLGVALFDRGRYDEALQAYHAALEILPAGDIYANIGRVLDKTGKPEEALLQYERGAKLDPRNADIQHYWATTLTALGRNEQALEHDAEAVRLQPKNAICQNDLGAALAAVDRKSEALAHYAEAVRLEPDSPKFQNNLATALARSGQEEAAIEHYEMAIREDPKYADAYSNLGALRAAQHRMDDAGREYTEAVRLNPTNAAIYLNAGIVFLKLGRTEDAVKQLAQATRIDPASTDAHYEYGRALILRGEFERARDELSQSVRIKPDNAPAYYYLGLACLELHSAPAGIKDLEEAARLRPNWAEPLNAEAWVLATSADSKVRDGQAAVRLAEQAASLTSRRQPTVLFTLSAAYAEAGRFDDAVATGNEASQLAQGLGQAGLVARINKAVELYQGRQPFRDAK